MTLQRVCVMVNYIYQNWPCLQGAWMWCSTLTLMLSQSDPNLNWINWIRPSLFLRFLFRSFCFDITHSVIKHMNVYLWSVTGFFRSNSSREAKCKLNQPWQKHAYIQCVYEPYRATPPQSIGTLSQGGVLKMDEQWLCETKLVLFAHNFEANREIYQRQWLLNQH